VGRPGDQVAPLGFDGRIPLAGGNSLGGSVGSSPIQSVNPAGEPKP